MKRSVELTALSREHHQSLRLAKQCLDTLEKADPDAIQALCQQIAEIFDQEWDRHFNNEEITIFRITSQMDGEIQQLGKQLVAEHQAMRAMAQAFKQGDCSQLQAFGEMLRDHTRMEERKLFPLVETQFDAEQLRFIQQHS